MDTCLICKKCVRPGGEETVVIGQKGSDGINKASKLRNDSIIASAGITVHKECRRIYINPREIKLHVNKNVEKVSISIVTRSQQKQFVMKDHCLFCGEPDFYYGKKKVSELIPVKTDDKFKETILDECSKRSDSWSDIVKGRIEFVQDLFAADAVYHQTCSTHFRTGKSVPNVIRKRLSSTVLDDEAQHVRKRGRPIEEEKEQAFLEVAQYLKDNDDEQITVTDLVARMENLLRQSECVAYTGKHMKNKLMEHFSDKIVFTEINGRSDVVTLKSKASSILYNFYKAPKSEDPEAEKIRVIQMAAELIKSDIKSMKCSKAEYPTPEDLSSVEEAIRYLPESLKLLLETLFVGVSKTLKVASIGQAIMQASRPRVLLAPLQVGLGVQFHHLFGSQFLIETLNRHGYCISYPEVLKYESCAALASGTDIPDFRKDQFVQYAADNVDHNIRTIDGLNTFHGMGIIAAITPRVNKSLPVPRCKVTKDDIAAVGTIKIHYHEGINHFSNLVYEDLLDVQDSNSKQNLHILWKLMWPLRSPRTSWSGMMQMVRRSSHPGQSSVIFLPMIDLNPSDMSCIYSTLVFICNHAKKYSTVPVVTFDQPLWWKAAMLLENETTDSDVRQVVLKLGGFHIEMSFLGCIGSLMAESGITEALKTIYAENVIQHILSGKAVQRAVRAHQLLVSVINALLLEKAFGISLSDTSETSINSITNTYEVKELNVTDPLLKNAVNLYDDLVSGKVSEDDICANNDILKAEARLENLKTTMNEKKTCMLWLQYVDMVDLLLHFLEAERTGNWKLHLYCIQNMLPFFAAAGHNMYTKTGYLYLQKMQKLATDHPEVYNSFLNGLHVVRRSNRFWAGLSTDLVIEQVLMRSLKSSGGLTRGRGMQEHQRTVWLLSMPKCAELNSAMQELASLSYVTSEQHKDNTISRLERDNNDARKLLSFFEDKNPFSNEKELRNIATGMVASPNVNVYLAKNVGLNIIKSMSGSKIKDHTFKRKDQAVTLAHKSAVNVDGETVQIDPQLLFQRLVYASNRDNDLKETMFKYELCSYPSALFDMHRFMLQANKPVLADELWKLGSFEEMEPIENVHHVIDGGALLQRIPWNHNATFDDICESYITYMARRYVKATIVFDGYPTGPSTKETAHSRRSKGMTSQTVLFEGNMINKMKKEKFLLNVQNKQRFINCLSHKLLLSGYLTVHAEEDADVLIVKTAVDRSSTMKTVVVGDDTDLLVLLCFHAKMNNFDVIFKPETKSASLKKTKIWNIKALKRKLGVELCKYILFSHAILGCDTTSHLFGIGKGLAVNKLLSSANFRSCAEVFTKPDSEKKDVIVAGERALVDIYGGIEGDTLDTLRKKIFCQKTAESVTFVQVKKLPPTSASAIYHSLRVYYQVQVWTGSDKLNPTDWGWHLTTAGTFAPHQTDMPPAPTSLLKLIRCKCKTSCGKKCGCRKRGLKCSEACSECQGSCLNSEAVDDIVDNLGDCEDQYI